MNHLLLDIGNTRVKIAAQPGEANILPMVSAVWSDPAACRSAVTAAWNQLPAKEPRAVAIASVSPEHLTQVRTWLIELNATVLVLREQVPLPMTVEVDNPETVGVDRVCAAAAAYDVLKCPLVVASFGTAITVDAVNAAGVFLGGAILPGLESQARALHEFTAQLPRVPLTKPKTAIGRNTAAAIQSGVFYGVIGALRELVEQFAEKLGGWPMVVVTGGGAPLLLEACDFVDRHVDNLTLRGLKLAVEKYEARPPAGS